MSSDVQAPVRTGALPLANRPKKAPPQIPGRSPPPTAAPPSAPPPVPETPPPTEEPVIESQEPTTTEPIDVAPNGGSESPRDPPRDAPPLLAPPEASSGEAISPRKAPPKIPPKPKGPAPKKAGALKFRPPPPGGGAPPSPRDAPVSPRSGDSPSTSPRETEAPDADSAGPQLTRSVSVSAGSRPNRKVPPVPAPLRQLPTPPTSDQPPAAAAPLQRNDPGLTMAGTGTSTSVAAATAFNLALAAAQDTRGHSHTVSHGSRQFTKASSAVITHLAQKLEDSDGERDYASPPDEDLPPLPPGGPPSTGPPPVPNQGPPAIPVSRVSSAMPGLVTSQSSQDLSQRAHIVLEILKTEEVYVSDVKFIVSNFLLPMRAQIKIVSSTEVAKIFSNIEMIDVISTEFLQKLKEAVETISMPSEAFLGEIFSTSVEQLANCYSVYCSAHADALKTLEKLKTKPDYVKLIQSLEANEQCRSLKLVDFIVKPVQRICKYPLLLRELLKNTTTEHPDFNSVEVAAKAIEQLVTKVNATAKEAENLNNLLRIEGCLLDAPKSMKLLVPGRKLVREGMWTKLSGKNVQDRYLFLFNDMIVYTKPSLIQKNHYNFKGIIPLHLVKIEDHPDSSEYKNAIKLTRLDFGKVYIIFHKEFYIKAEWLPELKTAADMAHRGERDNREGIAFQLTDTSPALRRDAVLMMSIETRVQGWENDNPTRRFLYDGPVGVQISTDSGDADADKKGHIFVFNDIVVVCRRTKKETKTKPFEYKDTIDMRAMVVEDLFEIDKKRHAFCVVAMSTAKKFTFFFMTDAEKNKYLSLFDEKMQEFLGSTEETHQDAPLGEAANSASVIHHRASISAGAGNPSMSTSFAFKKELERLSENENEAGTKGAKVKKTLFGRKLGYSTTQGPNMQRRMTQSGDAALRSTSSDSLPIHSTASNGMAGNPLVHSASAALLPSTNYTGTDDDDDRPIGIDGFETPPWDSDDSTDNCTGCQSKFGSFNRKHHCRNCGKIYCSKCLNKKCFLPRYGFTKKKQKVCQRCFLKH